MTVRIFARVVAFVLLLGVPVFGCSSGPKTGGDPLLAARRTAIDSEDGEVLGRWLLLELVAPGGRTSGVRSARQRLDDVAKSQRGVYASLARALDDEAHGRLSEAARRYLDVLDGARTHEGPEAELVAWYASSRLLRLRPSVADIWPTAKPIVERAIRDPGRIGFRARGDLVDWWVFDTRREGKVPPRQLDDEVRRRLGCVEEARLAGPFGGPAPLDVVTHFDAEKPGPWPVVFARDARRVEPPRILPLAQQGPCSIRATGPTGTGVHYVETFIELRDDTSVVLAVQAAWSVLVDDVEVLARDPRVFGIWPRFAVAVRLAAGRHRIVARIGAPDTSIRVLDLRGAPVDASSSSDPAAPYAMTAPKPLPDPNALAPFLADVGVREDPVWPRAAAGYAVDTADPILRFVAADLAHVDGQDDLASVLFEPLVKDASNATALALATQAAFVDGDPVFAPNDARDLALDLRRRATDKDAGLWFPRLWLLLDAAEKGGAKDQLAQLAELAASFPDVPAVGKALAQLYARLGYKPEHQRTILSLAQRFPDDTEILRALLSVQDDAGRHAEADKTVERITRLEPSSTIEVERALLRADFATAAAVVEREAKSASDENRAALARRVNDLLLRAGKRSETLALVERELAESGAAAGLRVADARLAAGDHAALRRALADAILTGAETAELRDAIEVVDGITELESFRLDPMATIRAYEASGAAKAGMEKGKGSAGTAARVLDYAAMSVHKDGSARMLEHEILHMQSREAITEHAEQRLPRGKLLRIRTIKPDGRTFEPEVVAGKPTVTMPHLELGDYIETETLYDMPSEGRGGRSFVGPRWFFREEKVDYHQSEFVVISPKDRPLVVEVTGAVPQPSVVEQGEIVVRRWRVDKNPALPQEPFAARIEEFLPSVRVGWGVTQAETLRRLSEAVTNVTPADPRLVRVAKTIATAGAPEAEQARQLAKVPLEERARRVYRWVLDNVEPGREADPRRTVLGKTGNRVEAFVYLARLAGVEVRHALVQDRLAPPPVGPISEAELFSQLALVMKTTRGETWTVVGDKYAPFGYLPSSLRGQPAVVLEPDLPRTKTNRGGTLDGVAHEGEVKLAGDGSARIALEQRYEGRLAIELRTAIQSLPEDRLKDVVEAKLLAQAIPGGRLSSLDIQGLVDLDGPLVLKMAVEASTFARRQGNDLVLSPPMQVSLAGVASLDKRETPLIVAREGAIRVAVRLRITLPDGAKVASVPAPAKGDNDGRSFAVNDRLERGVLLLDRVLDVPSGRVQPADYPAFVAFARAVDEALQPEFVIHLR